MLEKKTLKYFFVPNPEKVEPSSLKQFLGLVQKRLNESDKKDQSRLEKQIEEMVADLYALSDDDRLQIGMELSS